MEIFYTFILKPGNSSRLIVGIMKFKYSNIDFIFGIRLILLLTSATISQTYSTFQKNYRKSMNSKIINIRAASSPIMINKTVFPEIVAAIK